MTCIVGIESDGKVYMGGDSAACTSWEIYTSRLPKVFKTNGFLIGYTSSFRMGQLLQHQLEVREQKPDEPDMSYMVCAFIEGVRRCLKEHGYTTIDNHREEIGQFLVGYKGTLYEVGSDLQVNSYSEGIYGVGCGADFAMGAIKALDNLLPIERIKKALAIAEFYSNGVRGPFTVLEA